MDYPTLASTVRSFVENDFPATLGTGGLSSEQQIDTIIRQAEQRIYNSVQLLATRVNKTGVMTANVPYLATPIDWLSTFSLALTDPVTGEYEYLLNKDVSFIREAFPPPNAVGKPTHYAYFDHNTFLLGPTPDFPYVSELHYYAYPESITVAATGRTWLGDNFDSVLLSGSLVQAYIFMKGEADVLAMYDKQFGEAMVAVKQYAEGKTRQDMYRTEQVRYPVK